MSMGYVACKAEVVKWECVKKLIPLETTAFEEVLQHASVTFNEAIRALANDEIIDFDFMDEPPDDETRQRIFDAWVVVAEAFEKATTVNGEGLTLSPGYHDSSAEGSCYDEVDGSFLSVEGVWQLSPAGKKFNHLYTTSAFVSFG